MTSAVRERQSGDLHALGNEAGPLEGKLPQYLEFQRPFWSDRIVDRTLLRTLLEEVVALDRVACKEQRYWPLHEYVILLPDGMSSLQQQWLLRTAREAGLWMVRPLLTSQIWSASQGGVARGGVRTVLDIGFSGMRLNVSAGMASLVAVSQPDLGLQSLCVQLRDEEERRSGVRLALTALYDQTWQRQHPAFDTSNNTPVTHKVSNEVLAGVSQAWAEQIAHVLQRELQGLPAEVRASLSRSGISLIGGASGVSGLVSTLENRLQTKVSAASDAVYAALRMAASTEGST